MTLQEIFKDQPHLLEEPAVKALIKYVQEQHTRSWKINQRLEKENFAVLELCMYSEVILLEGRSSRETVEKILELHNS